MDSIDPPQMASYNKKSNSNGIQAPREQIGLKIFFSFFYLKIFINDTFAHLTATNVKGTVKWFHRVRGFGFVTR